MTKVYLLSCGQELYLSRDAQYFWVLAGRPAELLHRFLRKCFKAVGHFQAALVHPGGVELHTLVIV